MKADEEIYSFAGLGSKGFLFAPLCSEILAAQILGEACPAPSNLVKTRRDTFSKEGKSQEALF